MSPRITIIAKGDALDEKQAQAALNEIPELTLQPVSESRGMISGAGKALTLVGEFLGSSGKIADSLIEMVGARMSGSTVEVKIGDTVVKVTGANRDQIIELLNLSAKIATAKADL